MNTKQVLLDIARQDLESARNLFEKKLYSQAIFYLEQAVEKATKSLGLYQNIISEDELEDIGHESIEIYVRVIKGLKSKVIRFRERVKQFPKLKHVTLIKKYENLDLEKFTKIVDGFEASLKEPISQISDEELDKLLSELAKIEREIEARRTIEKDELENLKQLYQGVADAILDKHPEFRENVEKELTKFGSLTPEAVEKLVTSSTIPRVICNYSLMFLSAILSPHAIPPRYPYPKRGHDPLIVYTPEHPLIKRFDQIARTTESVLDKMTVLYSQELPEELSFLIKESGG